MDYSVRPKPYRGRVKDNPNHLYVREIAMDRHDKHMNEVEKLAWMIAEEFVAAFESLELLIVAEAEEEIKPLVMAAGA